MRHLDKIRRLDALIAIAEQQRLPAQYQPRQVVTISGGLADRTGIGCTVGQFRIRGGLPPLPWRLDAFDERCARVGGFTCERS
jgi:hypothetical protein